MILEGSDSAFRRIDSVDVRRNTLELDVIFLEGGFQFLRTLVVEDVEIGWMPLLDEEFVCGLPCVSECGGFSVGNRDGVDVVGVLVVQDNQVVVAAGGENRELTCLIGVALEEWCLGE
jgi:hypothetical protein